jgi:hypothetical protein
MHSCRQRERVAAGNRADAAASRRPDADAESVAWRLSVLAARFSNSAVGRRSQLPATNIDLRRLASAQGVRSHAARMPAG